MRRIAGLIAALALLVLSIHRQQEFPAQASTVLPFCPDNIEISSLSAPPASGGPDRCVLRLPAPVHPGAGVVMMDPRPPVVKAAATQTEAIAYFRNALECGIACNGGDITRIEWRNTAKLAGLPVGYPPASYSYAEMMVIGSTATQFVCNGQTAYNMMMFGLGYYHIGGLVWTDTTLHPFFQINDGQQGCSLYNLGGVTINQNQTVYAEIYATTNGNGSILDWTIRVWTLQGWLYVVNHLPAGNIVIGSTVFAQDMIWASAGDVGGVSPPFQQMDHINIGFTNNSGVETVDAWSDQTLNINLVGHSSWITNLPFNRWTKTNFYGVYSNLVGGP